MTSISITATSPRRYMLNRDDGPTLQIVEWGSTTPRVTIILAHGLALSHGSWEDVAQLVVTADPTVRVLAYDHRGHGESQSAPASLELLADDLAAVVSAFAPTGPIVLGGHSMGGMTLMALAERHCAILGARVIGAAFVATGAGDILGRLMRRRIWSRLVSLALTAAPFLVIPSRPLLIVRQLTRGVLFGARPTAMT
ncbi:alpha/beta hydrolase [Nocardia africana]|uniref:Non-heme chloroperoxidase n=1 Tax=Nocardia africana TaxID=134964 RepID=A0A378X5A0_9NOCA|nr:alpha/beta fold hydrolase [Nocardia africana]SUA48589.1 Non-heme chloroperoxidase [Nocardia africana]